MMMMETLNNSIGIGQKKTLDRCLDGRDEAITIAPQQPCVFSTRQIVALAHNYGVLHMEGRSVHVDVDELLQRIPKESPKKSSNERYQAGFEKKGDSEELSGAIQDMRVKMRDLARLSKGKFNFSIVYAN